MTQPGQVEALTLALIHELDRLHTRILDELRRAVEAGGRLPASARVRRLQETEQLIRRLLDDADQLAATQVAQRFRDVYELGAWVTALTQGVGATFTQVDADALLGVVTDTMQDLLAATRWVRQEVKDTIRDLVKLALTEKVTVGATPHDLARRLVADLTDRGITAVVYANGARVPLPVYARMVVRTRSAELYQEAGFNQGERLGVTEWLILDGPGCGLTSHDDPQEANGMVVDLDTARRHPISHPNCRRSTTPNVAGVDLGDLAERAMDEAHRANAHVPAPTRPARRTTGTIPGGLPATPAAARFTGTLRRHGLTPPG